MTSKIIRADGTTELASVKAVTYHESVNADIDLRPGCVASSYIEVTCFGAQTDVPDVGEALTYYQVVGETETLIGIFYAEPSIPTKNSYSFIAYDSVHKLDADFSSWLSAHQEDFPYTVYQLVSQACTIAGVTLGSSSWENSTMEVNAWYADSITCRNILQYAAEIACKFVRCNTSGEIIFDWYKGATSGETKTASGAIATFDDGADGLPLKKLVAQINPVQDLHEQDAPYPPGGGKNKFNYSTYTAGRTGFGLKSSVVGEYFRFTGTCTSGGSHSWTFANVPSADQELATTASYKAFVISGNAPTITSISYNSSSSRLQISTNDLVLDQVYDFTIGVVGYTDGVEPTAFSPYSNECPISGWTGCTAYLSNTAPTTYIDGKYYNDNGSLSVSSNIRYEEEYLPVMPNVSYTFQFLSTSSNRLRVHEYSADRTWLRQIISTGVNTTTISYVPSDDAKYIRLSYPIACGSIELYISKLQVSWQDTAGTVYGGNIVVNEDGSGAMVVTNAKKVFDGSQDEAWNDYPSYSGYYISLSEMKLGNRHKGISNMLVAAYNSSQGKNKMWLGVNTKNFFAIGVYESMGSTLTDFRNFLAANNLEVVIPLDTPLTYTFSNLTQLTTLLGTNNIWVDTGDVEVEYYTLLGKIYPTSGTFDNVDCYAYKQDGLNYDNYDVTALARVAVHPVGEDEVAYYYPTGVTSGNTLDITNNALLYGASAEDMSGIAQTVYDGITAVGQYRPMNVNMFPNECPFRSGQIVPVTDAQGVSFTTAIMRKTVTESAVNLASTGREVYGDYARDTAKKLIQLAADIVQINKLKVDWAEIDQIFARDITVTGQLHSQDYSYTDGNIYANQGMGMDFGEKRYNTPNFGITPDGNVYAQGGKISGFNIRKGEYEEVIPSAPTYTNTGYSYADGYLTVTQAGKATFSVPMSYTVGGVTKPLTRIVYQCYYGTSSSLPQFYNYNFTYVGTSSGQFGMVQYVPVGDDSLNSIIPNGDLLLQSTSLSLTFTLIANSSCRIFFQYGNYYSLYTENQEIGKGKSNVYVGDDGISVGESIILTPDGNAKIDTLDVGNKRALRESLGLGTNGVLPITVDQGGTGSVAVETTTTAADIATAESGYTLTATNFAKWGKVAMANVSIRKSTAVTTDSNLLIATLVSDKRPVARCGAVATNSNIWSAYVEPNGEVHIRGTVPENTTIGVYFTYLLP